MDVKKLIKSRGYTLEQVARELGTAQSSLSQCISGNPTVEKLRDIARVIDCDIADFFNDETKHNPPFVALIKSGNDFFEAHSLNELKVIVKNLDK